MSDIFVSEAAASYIRRLILEADARTTRPVFTPLSDAIGELEKLAKMVAKSKDREFVIPEDVKEMVAYVISRRHFAFRADTIIDVVPLIEPAVRPAS